MKPDLGKTYDNYSDFVNDHKDELLRDAVTAIDPVKMGMTRHEAMTLIGALKNCGFTEEDFARIASKSPNNKGTFNWDDFDGKSKGYGEAGEGTIFDYAKRSGWAWPAPNNYGDETVPESSKKPQKAAPKVVDMAAAWRDDFKLRCLFDSQEYKSKPANVWEVRNREQIPTPAPQPMTVQEFARAVTSGRTFYPTVYSKEQDGFKKDGRPKYNYRAVEQQVFVVDVDNEESYRDESGKERKRRIEKPLTIDAALRICDAAGIAPFFTYETFSSKAHRDDVAEPYQKFRLCFALDEPLTVQEVGERGIATAINYFIGLFGPAADSKTVDSARLIYGTDERDRAKLYPQILSKKKMMQRFFAPQEPAKDDVAGQDPGQGDPGDVQAAPMMKEEYLQHSAAGYMQAFEDFVTASADKPPISTGFFNLDKILDGGLYEGLYIMGAISSLGKTTLALQIADNIAQQDTDVLIISLEMARNELMAKSISRLTYTGTTNQRNAKTTRGIMAGSRYAKYNRTERELIEKAKAQYLQFAQHVFICEGIGDIGVREVKDIVLRHIALTGNRPVVLIDYIQILAPYDPRCSDKQNTDKAVLELKRLSRDCGIPVIGISSFNRESYKEKPGRSGNKGRVTTADFKESGAIEYSADVLIGLEFQSAGASDYSERTEKRKDPREINLIILKNRNGKAYERAAFEYYPKFNYYAPYKGGTADFKPAAEAAMEDGAPWEQAPAEAQDVFAGIRGKAK